MQYLFHMTLIETIHHSRERLTKSQEKALRYILDHYEEATFLPLSRLTRSIGVSEATLIRLAQALGFSGFPEFKKELQSLVRQRLTTVARLEHTVEQLHGEEHVLTKVFQQDIENLTHTLKDIHSDVFTKVVDAISKAPRITIIGLRTSYSLAIFLGLVLRYLEKEVTVLSPDHGEFWDHVAAWRRNDLIIGISFPRDSRMTIEAVQHAKTNGIMCIGITDHALAPLAHYCSLVLTARCTIDSYIESYTAPLSLINAIATALSVRNPKQTLQSLKKFEAIWQEKDIYINP